MLVIRRLWSKAKVSHGYHTLLVHWSSRILCGKHACVQKQKYTVLASPAMTSTSTCTSTHAMLQETSMQQAECGSLPQWRSNCLCAKPDPSAYISVQACRVRWSCPGMPVQGPLGRRFNRSLNNRNGKHSAARSSLLSTEPDPAAMARRARHVTRPGKVSAPFAQKSLSDQVSNLHAASASEALSTE